MGVAGGSSGPIKDSISTSSPGVDSHLPVFTVGDVELLVPDRLGSLPKIGRFEEIDDFRSFKSLV